MNRKINTLKDKMEELEIILLFLIISGLPIMLSMFFTKANFFIIGTIEIIIYIFGMITRKIIESKTAIKSTFKEQYYREIPEFKPAILFYYINKGGHIYTNIIDFYATILDLINRKVLILETDSNKENSIKINPDENLDGLCKFEKNLLELIFYNSNRKEVKLSVLKKEFETNDLLQYKIDAWKMLVEIDANKENILLENKIISILNKISGMIIVILYMISFVILFLTRKYYINEYIYIILFGAIAFFFNMSIVNKYTYTQKIIDEVEKSKALERFIKDYSLMHEKSVEEINIWEGYLIYATILKTPKKIEEFFDEIFI